MPTLTVETMISTLGDARPLASYKRGDRLRSGRYTYVLAAAPGDLTDQQPVGEPFAPDLTPAEILMLGAFEGRYLNDAMAEFPREWFAAALHYGTLRPEGVDPTVNLFGIKSRQPLSVWKENGWAPSAARRGRTDDHYKGLLGDPARNPDERGWFQWYCRYWMGRRLPEIDAVQIRRWRAFRRHAGAVRGGCPTYAVNPTCRARERQALLQWGHNPFI
jgi:hypothetical protein